MSSISGSLSVVACISTFLVAKFFYEFSGWRWKARPWIPFFLGVALLFGGASFYWSIEDTLAKEKVTIDSGDKRVPEQTLNLLSEFVKANTRQLKLLELVVIPFAVSFIVTGVLMKIDRDYNERIQSYTDAAAKLEVTQTGVATSIAAVERAVANGIRGKLLLELHRDAESRQRRAMDEWFDFEEEFQKLVDAGVVPRLPARRAVQAPRGESRSL